MDFLRKRDGTLWIVSPFITTTPPERMIHGSRVLTTLDPAKLASGASTFQALAALLEGGAEVRILPKLHAKVYLRMHGSEAVGFSGSANLTLSGERHNHEVMTGPETFSIGFMRDLTHHWAAAAKHRLTMSRLIQEQEKAERLSENLAAQKLIESGVVVILIDTQMLRGSFELTESKVGIPIHERTKGFRPARVDFVQAKNRKQGIDLLQAGLKRLQSSRTGQAIKLKGSLSFAVPVAEHDNFQDGLQELNSELRTTMGELVKEHAEAWQADFITRLQQAAQRYVRADPDRVQAVLEGAASSFDKYIKKLDVGLSYGTYLPLQTPSRPLAHDFRTYFQGVRENQPLNWEDDVEA
ncbi:hypothetical protein GCM10008949_44830 [Deinococcus humi]|nr:hypothetical protein GCM10008949_44830 [Deinococcus humi]